HRIETRPAQRGPVDTSPGRQSHARTVRLYQSEYFVPSSAVAVDVECTSNTLLPLQPVASKSSWTARRLHSARPVIGSTGMRGRTRFFSPPAPPYSTPFTSVSKFGG